jgi:hypothetical protein
MHTNQEMVLIFNQKDQDILTESIFGRSHIVLWVGKETWLKDGSKICRGHLVQIRLGREDSQKVEDVQEQLSIERWELSDEALVSANSLVWIERPGDGSLQVHWSHSLSLMVSQRIAESVIEVEGDYRLGQLVEISAQDVCRIVHSIASPVQSFAVAIWRIKGKFQLLDSLFRATQPKDALDIGG